MKPRARMCVAWAAGMAVLVWMGAAIQAQAEGPPDVRTFEKTGAYDDVRFDLSNAIVNAGLSVVYTGQIGQMLERTGADFGSTMQVYKSAEFFSFCSVRLSRQMMEADPNNIAYCPFTVFVYESAARPGTVVVGYRRPPQGLPSPAAAKVVAEADALLEKIAREAVEGP